MVLERDCIALNLARKVVFVEEFLNAGKITPRRAATKQGILTEANKPAVAMTLWRGNENEGSGIPNNGQRDEPRLALSLLIAPLPDSPQNLRYGVRTR
jgi:hypothetical protein